MRRTWLTAVVPITLACTSLLLPVSAATEHTCFRDAGQASEAADAFRASGSEVNVSTCDTSRAAKQVNEFAFDRADSVGPFFSFAVAPDRSISDFPGLASRPFAHRAEVGKVKPSIRGKPP